MSNSLNDEFTIGITTGLVTPKSLNYRLPSLPPPRNWPVVLDKNGSVVSVWGDSKWDLSPWAEKPASLNFGDGQRSAGYQAESLSVENADVMRIVATMLIWGPKAAGAVSTVKANFSIVRQIVAHCNRHGISAANLMRYPKIFETLPEAISVGQFRTAITMLHRLYDARDVIGFTIINTHGIKRLIGSAPDNNIVQTPYIPPRIWLYQVKRLHECLEDFLAHRERIEECFMYCINAYIKNFGSLQAALDSEQSSSRNPFSHLSAECAGSIYHGKFCETASRFGVGQLLSKWVLSDEHEATVSSFSTYLTTVTFAGLCYIANFTLQRKEEVAALRTSCLTWEEDERLGRVAIICGQTTKTEHDSSARWVASPSVETAVKALSAIAHLRMTCDRVNPKLRPTVADQMDPYLLSSPSEPWGNSRSDYCYEIRSPIAAISNAIKAACKKLFDKNELRIRQDDLTIALRLTPNLPKDKFAVGKVWPLAWHQYRRTSAVNMFASGDISDSTMQHQMKHASRLMPLYYGRNHSRLQLNSEVEKIIVHAMYQAQAEKIHRAASSDTFVSPHSRGRQKSFEAKVLSIKDLKDLVTMARNGTVSFRENRLGGCMKAGACEYGGIESVARCAGGDGGKACPEVLFDRTKEVQVRADMRRVALEIKQLPTGNPRYSALIAEYRAMENFVNVVTAS